MKKEVMRKNRIKRNLIPKRFKNIEDAAEFWDSHDLADYWASTREAHFEVNLQRRVFLAALEPNLAKKLTALAHKQGISTETLINLWLTEKAKEFA
ncbi:MAG: CopG family antitoxin [Planctomycetota bacterium]